MDFDLKYAYPDAPFTYKLLTLHITMHAMLPSNKNCSETDEFLMTGIMSAFFRVHPTRRTVNLY